MATSFPMSDDDSVYSFSKDSQILKEVLDSAKDMLRDAIIQNLDIKIMFSSSNTLHIADLGCSIGPNTFIAMQHVVQVLKEKYHNNNILEFQVFFNDHVTNDFNTLFRSVPIDRSYYAFGVPGTFHGRLFPSRSIHFAHCSTAIHWLSKCPEELLDEKSPAWNKGLIHYAGTSNVEVLNAYVAQFEKDMEMMVIISPQSIERLVKFFGSCLIDLVNEGMLDESLFDSFNLPMYFPSPEDMTKVVEKNDCFSIEIMELTYLKSKLVEETDAKTL
ncbi:hypothetical protein T459_21238 [Capsicum annuum]|uniref:Uncharacterized protein n=1 Tax=Capsicum annuum TaxID=4072 RepID=A0A2G2YWF9_CAPAN|nr:hypothetical protein T459_21238 [Capsicum annuum]